VSDPSGAAVAGSVTYSGTTATFTPSAVASIRPRLPLGSNPRRNSAAFQLCVEFYNRYSSAHGHCHDPCERGSQRAHWAGAQRELQ
jgi:hypothetical protein